MSGGAASTTPTPPDISEVPLPPTKGKDENDGFQVVSYKKRHKGSANKATKRARSPRVDFSSCSAAKLSQKRRDQIKSGLTNRAVDAEGNTIRVPLHKAPELSGSIRKSSGNNPITGSATQQGPKVTPSGQNTSPSKQRDTKEPSSKPRISYAQVMNNGSEDYFLTVVRKDKGEFTRGDQWHVQFAVSDSMVKAVKEGKMGDQIAHNGTKKTERKMFVFCTKMSGQFYKSVINKLVGYEAYLPEDRKPGHEIYSTVPRMAQPTMSNLVEHFAAGTFGAIKPEQVRISRKPWSSDTSNIHLYLEVDDKAFDWLRTKSWFSALGLFQLRWAHPPVKGLKGYIAPDQDPQAIKRDLLAETRRGSQVPSTSSAQSQDREISLSEVDKDIPEELKGYQQELTETQENELFGDEFNSTVIHSTPTKVPKTRRRTKEDGTAMTDPSDKED